MHIVFVNYKYPEVDRNSQIFKNYLDKNIRASVVQRNDRSFINDNFHFVRDSFENSLKWWQNPEELNEYIGKLFPDLIYVFGLNLPLHFRWLKHHIPQETIILAQHCGEEIWIQKNLWLQQSALRIVDGFVFKSQEDAYPWLKSSAILESQPVFEINRFQTDAGEVYSKLLNSKSEYDN